MVGNLNREKYVLENLHNCVNRVKNAVYQKIVDLDLEIYTSKEPLPFSERQTGAYRKILVGEKWGGLFDCAWFHCTADVPVGAAGKKLVYVIDINGEGLLFDHDGCPVRGITNVNSVFDRAMGNPGKRIVPFLECSAGGESVDFWLDAGCNDLTGNLQENGTIKEACVASCNDTARKLFYDMLVLLVQAESTSSEDPLHYELLDVLNRCRKKLVTYSEVEMADCLAVTEQRLALKGGDSPALSLTAFGHAHIDLGWLWPIRETKRKGARTFSTALALMERYPEYLFGASQPQLYQWVKEDYPQLYEKVRASIGAGRWELLGAMWAEPDLNLISGESVVRHILYGNAFWKKEFGQTVHFVWTPDTFGYSAALPQIFKKSGIDFFATIKMSWNLINDFPYTNFRWRGIDGSEVLVHMPPEGNYVSEGTAKSVRKIKRKLFENGQFGEVLLPFGIGDGGGGPSPCHLEYLRREENLPGLCPIRQGKMSEFFGRFEQRAKEFPVWNDELYLERHLGVYTSAARNKKYNRLMELILRDAEILSAIALRVCGTAYPQEALETIWKEVLLYQFHDILPGSSIQRVYDESLARYEILYRQAKELRDAAARTLARQISAPGMQEPVAVFNTLSFARDYLLKTENGVIPVTLPPMGYAVVDLVEAKHMQISQTTLENNYLRVTILDDGSIGGIYQKELGTELLRAPSNLLYIFDDIENAWNLQYDYRNQQPERAELTDSRYETEDGTVTLVQNYQYRNSSIELWVSLGENDRVLTVFAHINWQEKHKMLRIAFVTDVDTDRVNCETQFGYVRRSTRSNTTQEQAQIEMVAHKWIALSRPGLNFVLLNDCKYGYSVNDNVIELNAIRGTDYPAKQLDFGEHEFRYGIYADDGADLTATVRAGWEFNVAPICVPAGGGANTAKNYSYLTLKSDHIIIDGIKKAEESDDLILRTYEAIGRRGEVRVETQLTKELPTICDLREQDVADPAEIISYRPFDIISYRLK